MVVVKDSNQKSRCEGRGQWFEDSRDSNASSALMNKDTVHTSTPRSAGAGKGKATLPLGIFCFLTVIYQAGLVGGRCPHDVSKEANMCFTDFSREYQNVQNSQHGLCCGIDVEYLRAFCESYKDGMRCINKLRTKCPESVGVERPISNLHGSEIALNDMCEKDILIEVYSRLQSCLTDVGPGTESCFRRHLNVTGVRLMSNVEARHTSEFCSNMKRTMDCIQSNVRPRCGSEAVDLVSVLVKPMVRHSSKCDYSIATIAPVSQQGEPAKSSHGSDNGGINGTSGGPAFSCALLPVSLLAALRTLLRHS